jgi:hypothetical protein
LSRSKASDESVASSEDTKESGAEAKDEGEEEDSSDSISTKEKAKSKNKTKLKCELKALGVKNPYLRSIYRSLRSITRSWMANSVIDIKSYNELVTLLCKIAQKDAMVMQCIKEELFRDPPTDERAMYSAVESGYREPRGYRTMLKQKEPERSKWIEGVMREVEDFAARGVYKVIKMHEVPEGRRLIGSKLVFKVKRDGRFRSRIVALGYTQIPGVDYSDNYAPVVGYVTLRILLVKHI